MPIRGPDCVPFDSVAVRPDVASVVRQLDFWFEPHPHKALRYRSPGEFRRQLVDCPTTRSTLGVDRMSRSQHGDAQRLA